MPYLWGPYAIFCVEIPQFYRLLCHTDPHCMAYFGGIFLQIWGVGVVRIIFTLFFRLLLGGSGWSELFSHYFSLVAGKFQSLECAVFPLICSFFWGGGGSSSLFQASHHGVFFCHQITAISRLPPLESWGHEARFGLILALF